jgi:lysophospholipase L1-like esterase
LYSHSPLDLVILALGGNDLEKFFEKSAKEICKGMEELITLINASKYGGNLNQPPKILVLSVPLPLSTTTFSNHLNYIATIEESYNKATQVNKLFETLAESTQCYFLDNTHIKVSNLDGMHYDVEGHALLATLIYKKIISIYSECETTF